MLDENTLKLYSQIITGLHEEQLSNLMTKCISLAKLLQEFDFEKWLKLETSGYFDTNSALTDDIHVPTYRMVPGMFLDGYSRPIDFGEHGAKISQYPLREGVRELETLCNQNSPLEIKNPLFKTTFKKAFKIDVVSFRFESSSISGILSNIRVELIDRIHLLKIEKKYVNYNNKMRTIKDIENLILDVFIKNKCKSNHVVLMRVFELTLVPRLNPEEQKMYVEAANNLITNGYIKYEEDSPRCFRLTDEGYNYIYKNKTISNEDKSPQKKLPLIVILTAIKEEYSAIREHLVKIEDADIDNIGYEKGIFQFDGEIIASIIIRECGAKNTNAAQETERAIQNFSPNCIFFVGIAGSRKSNDFQIGDVIFPEKVYSYEGGKSEKNNFRARPEVVTPTHALIEIAKKERLKDDWKKLILGNWKQEVKADLGIIASGEKIIEHYESIIGNNVTNSYNDTSAFEMEGFGFISAAQRQGLKSNNTIIGLIRGISDIVEKNNEPPISTEENSDRRPKDAKLLASDTASAFAYWLIYKMVKKSILI